MPTTFATRAAATLAAAALTLAAGCGDSTDTTTTTPPAASTGGTTAAPDANKKLRVAGVVMQSDQFFNLIRYGMNDAAKKAGVDVTINSSENRPDEEIRLVETYATDKVDALVISPLSKTGSAPALEAAKKAGLKVVTYNVLVDGDLAAAHVECDQADLGRKSGQAAREYITKNLGGKAKVAMLAYVTQVPEQSNARSNGFKEEVMKLGADNVQIVTEQDAWLADAAQAKADAILTAHPEVNVLWGANEGGTVGAALAVANGGRAGKVAVFGTDCSDQLLSMLQADDNVLQAITSQPPVDMGRMAVESALKLARGETVEKMKVLPGTLVSRADPDGLKTFAATFAEQTKGN